MESIKVAPVEKTVLNATGTARGPDDQNCVMQLAHIHKLKDSEQNYDKHQHNLSMNMLRNQAGIAAPLVINMELHLARQIGRMPFLQSSNLMEDNLLNRDETISFSDFLGIPENSEILRHPHLVMEKHLDTL